MSRYWRPPKSKRKQQVLRAKGISRAGEKRLAMAKIRKVYKRRIWE